MTYLTPVSAIDLDSVPSPLRGPSEDLLATVRAGVERAGSRIIVVEDDPIGSPLVADIGVITHWDQSDIDWLLAQDDDLGYLLTNSRALSVRRAVGINRLIGERLKIGADRLGIDLRVVSRSDSTLRGHFPAEADALAEGYGRTIDATLLVPFFAEAGRITIRGTHYVRDGRHYVPVAHTPFAADKRFGFRNSDLRAWVAERTGGRISAAAVHLLDLDDIRSNDVHRAADVLVEVPAGGVCVADAVTYDDLAMVVAAVQEAERRGMRWMYRSAASLVPTLAGRAPAAPVQTPLLASDLGGLVVVGSHVPLATRQLQALLDGPNVVPIEAVAQRLIDARFAPSEIARLVESVASAIKANRLPVLFTSRVLITGDDGEQSSRIGDRVASAVSQVVASIPVSPAYLVAKGGFTAHTIATGGLGMRRARVLGPIVDGVPMWLMDASTRFPSLPFVIAPGSVGGDSSLSDVVDRLEASRR